MKNKEVKNIKWGDIFYCDLGKMNGSVQCGHRPVLVIQTNSLNKSSPTMVVAVITSVRKKQSMSTHILLDEDCGLSEPSMVALEQLRTIVKTMLNYRENKTISVPDLRRILGLGKTAVYRLVNQQLFKTYLVFGQMRVDVESFEEWYANQFHYKKVNGERPGRNYGHTITSTTIAKVLGISRATARDIVDRNSIEMIWVDGTRRVLEDSFEKWYASQSHYKKVMEIKEVERFVD